MSASSTSVEEPTSAKENAARQVEETVTKKKQPVRNKKKAKEGDRVQVIKLSYARLVNEDEKMRLRLNDWLRGAVRRLTAIRILATRFLLGFVLYCMEKKYSMPLLNQSLAGVAMSLVRGNVEKIHLKITENTTTKEQYVIARKKQMIRFYKNYFLKIFPPLPYETDDGRFFDMEAVKIETSIKTYLKTEFLKRHRVWCKFISCELLPNIKRETAERTRIRKAERHRIADFLFEQTANNGTREDVDLEALAEKCPTFWRHVDEDTLLQAIGDFWGWVPIAACPIMPSLLVDPNKNYQYMPWFYYLLQTREAHNRVCETAAGKKAKMDQVAVFTLLPIAQFKAVHVFIDSEGILAYLWRYRYKECFAFLGWGESINQKQARTDFKAREEEIWRELFMFPERDGLTFMRSISTDGVAASILYHKAMSPNTLLTYREYHKQQKKRKWEEKQNERKVARLGDERETDMAVSTGRLPEGAILIGVDPGKHEMFTTAQIREDEIREGEWKYESRQYSGRRWMQECGGNLASHNRELWALEQSAKQRPEEADFNDIDFDEWDSESASDDSEEDGLEEVGIVEEGENSDGEGEVDEGGNDSGIGGQEEGSDSDEEEICGEEGDESEEDTSEGESEEQEEDGVEQVIETKQDYHKWKTAMPTLCTTSLKDWTKSMRHLKKRFPELLDEICARKVRQQKFANYRKNQRALKQATDELCGGPENPERPLVVVFGDAKFQSTGPVQRIREKLHLRRDVTLIDFDEFRTSRLPSCCSQLEEVLEQCETIGDLEMLIPKGNDGKDIYSVRLCPFCHKAWNRDVNAAINILERCEYSLDNGGERELVYSRQLKRDDCLG